ncbi:MAG: hypothetical protein RBT36_01030 [Desulfobulbus sp.]|nr:hypothetical protein [Desulfobulbus sp.]
MQKFFRHSIRDQFAQAAGDRVSAADEDTDLLPEGKETLRLSDRVRLTPRVYRGLGGL